MNKTEIYKLFNEMITIADNLLFNFTIYESSKITVENKPDNTPVTYCDKLIDDKLTIFAKGYGFNIVSEEGEQALNIIKNGNYMTIDPIDGTKGYIEYFQRHKDENNLSNFGKTDYGPDYDFCLLIGIVENNIPSFGAVYNYITKEKIFVSSKSNSIFRENNVREFNGEDCAYLDRNSTYEIKNSLIQQNDIKIFTETALGLKSIYPLINGHTNSICLHRAQRAGIWDILPAMVVARRQNDLALDDFGNDIKLNEYIHIPGKGATFIHGDRFRYIKEDLAKFPNKS